MKITVPAACDAIATILMNVALLFIPVSIWQMLRGSIIVFTAFLTICFRKRKLYRYEVIGMSLVILAIVILGCVALVSSDNSEVKNAWVVILAVVLVIISQGIQAIQTIIEEVFLHDSTYPPMLLVAWEGFWGFVYCTFIFIPIAQFLPKTWPEGFYEDSIDTFVMINNNKLLIIWSILYAVAITFFNIFGMYITDVTNALTRNVIDPMRTLLLWVLSLLIYYIISPDFGEKLTWWSILQLFGFFIMTVGVFCYNGAFKIRCLMGRQEEEEVEVRYVPLNDETKTGILNGGGRESVEEEEKEENNNYQQQRKDVEGYNSQ